MRRLRLLNATLCAGIGQGRITNNLGTFVKDLDGALHIPDEKTIAMIYELLDTEGLYVGASSALNVVAAVELAKQLGPGAFPLTTLRPCACTHAVLPEIQVKLSPRFSVMVHTVTRAGCSPRHG